MTNLEKNFLESATRYFSKAQSKEIDWEQRRYEIARDALIALISKPEIVLTASDAKVAIRYADALIEKFKKENNG